MFNSICATLILGEPFTRYSLVGTLLVATGAVIIGIFGSVTEPSHNLDQLLRLLQRRQFLLWIMGTSLMILLVLALSWLARRLLQRQPGRLRLVRGMCFGFISGILSAHCLLVAKSAVELLVRTIVDRHNQFDRWQSWMILLGLVFLALTQLWCLHKGLKLCSTSVLYPFVFCIYNIIAIIDGLIYFRQSSRLSLTHAGLIAVGTVILLAGVLSLSWRLETQDQTITVRSRSLSQAHMVTPQTALAPGLGLVSAIDDPNEDGSVSSIFSEPFEQDFDEESGFGPQRAKKISKPKGRKGSASETTPLLRAATTPVAGPPRSKKETKLWSPKSLRKKRRTTMTEDAGDIWDELNDRGELRRSSHSSKSPRRLYQKARTRSATVAQTGDDVRKGHLQWRRRSWWGGTIPSLRDGHAIVPSGETAAVDSQDQEQVHNTEGEDYQVGDTAGAAPTIEANDTPIGDWFRLKWWKRRRRSDQDSGGGM